MSQKMVTYDGDNNGANIVGTAVNLNILTFGIFFQNRDVSEGRANIRWMNTLKY